jgi:hypothetical protein
MYNKESLDDNKSLSAGDIIYDKKFNDYNDIELMNKKLNKIESQSLSRSLSNHGPELNYNSPLSARKKNNNENRQGGYY